MAFPTHTLAPARRRSRRSNRGSGFDLFRITGVSRFDHTVLPWRARNDESAHIVQLAGTECSVRSRDAPLMPRSLGTVGNRTTGNLAHCLRSTARDEDTLASNHTPEGTWLPDRATAPGPELLLEPPPPSFDTSVAIAPDVAMAPDAVRPELTDSIVAGKWKLETRIGSGSFGEVWIARHLITGGRKALKLLYAEFSGTDLSSRFIREAQAASRTQSPHVVTVDDIGFDESLGRAYLIMELLRGESLFEHLSHAPFAMPASEAVAVLAQIAAAIDAAHAAGVIHRDLKPENVVLTWAADGSIVVKVLDFGIAKLAEARASMMPAVPNPGRALGPGTVGFIGTPGYASPEQMADAASVTGTADVFALGICAFEMLAGASYWRSADPSEVFAEVAVGIFAPPSLRAPTAVGLSAAFDDWFAKACAHDPNQRFASAGEAVRALEKALGLTGPFNAPRPRTVALIAAHPTLDNGPVRPAGVRQGVTVDAPADPLVGISDVASAAIPLTMLRETRVRPWSGAAAFLVAMMLAILVIGASRPAQRHAPTASRTSKSTPAPGVVETRVETATIAATPSAPITAVRAIAPRHRSAPAVRASRRPAYPHSYRATGHSRLYEPPGL